MPRPSARRKQLADRHGRMDLCRCEQYILGIQPTLAGLKIDPCIPHTMDGFTLRRVWRGATYEIVVENPDHLEKGVKAMTVDGKPVSGNILSPVPAGLTVQVKVVMG